MKNLDRSKCAVLSMSFIALLQLGVAHALTIKGVSHSSGYVENTNTPVTIRFALNESARVALNIYDDRELLIKRIESAGVLDKGDNAIVWDLTDHHRKPVPPEAYRYTLEATAGGDTVLHDLSDLTGNKITSVKDIHWDKASQSIHYTIVKPSRVSLRIGIKDGGPLLSTVMNWLPRNRGKHTQHWDGKNGTGELDISKLKNTDIFGIAYSLSENSVLVGPPQAQAEYVDTGRFMHEKRARMKTTNKPFDYFSRNADERKDFSVKLKFPEKTKSTKGGVLILEGVVPITVNVAQNDVLRMQQNRFEPILFIDGVYQSEVEAGFFPLTWRLDTSKLKHGEHYVTVNIRGYSGQYGTVSRRFIVN